MEQNYTYKGNEYYRSIVPLAMGNRFEDEWTGRYNSYTQLRSKWNVGPNIAMFNKHNPLSANEFFRQYTTDYNPANPHDKTCGRSIGQLWDVASEWKKRIDGRFPDDNTTLEQYMDMVILHVITETYIGGESERYLKSNILKKCPKYKILDLGASFDSDYAIDIVVANENNIIEKLIQVKPISTFTSKNRDTISDVNGFAEKNKKGLDFLTSNGYTIKEGIKVDYMLYDKYNEDGWYYSNKKKPFSFSLDELKDRNFVLKIKEQGSKKIWEEEKNK